MNFNHWTLMHGLNWQGNDLAGYFLSEKLDGWRAVWTGAEFYTRTGNRYAAPDWFKAGLPAIGLDGELVTAGQTSCNLVNAAVRAGEWHRLVYRPFDCLAPAGTVEAAQAILATLPALPHVRPVEWRIVADTQEALESMQAVQRAGGEGLMLRRPGSPYCGGRTADLLKMKPGNPALSLNQFPQP